MYVLGHLDRPDAGDLSLAAGHLEHDTLRAGVGRLELRRCELDGQVELERCLERRARPEHLGWTRA